jgi:hypothetical protein
LFFKPSDVVENRHHYFSRLRDGERQDLAHITTTTSVFYRVLIKGLVVNRTTMVANNKKKNNDDDSNSSRLLILCCTANMGNAQPTASGLEAWVPKNGSIQSVTALDSACRAKMMASSSSFDIIMVGMQEATWKTKKKLGKDDKVEHEEEEEEGDVDDEFYDYNDETERSGADDFATPAAPTEAETAKRDEMKKKWSSASFLKQMTMSEDSKFMRTLLQENLGTSYNMIQEYQRGQMRLYLFVKQSLVHEITNLDGKFLFLVCCFVDCWYQYVAFSFDF